MQYMQKNSWKNSSRTCKWQNVLHVSVTAYFKDGDLHQDGLEPRIVSPNSKQQAIVEAMWY